MRIIKEGDILVSIDVSGLYTNIPQSEGLEAVRDALEDRDDKAIPSEYIVKLLEIVLKHNIFEFDEELFIQLIGTAMGTRPAPSYANIFMARKIDNKIEELAKKERLVEPYFGIMKICRRAIGTYRDLSTPIGRVTQNNQSNRINTFHGQSWAVGGSRRQSGTVGDSQGQSAAVGGSRWLSGTVEDCQGQSGTVGGCRGQSDTIGCSRGQ